MSWSKQNIKSWWEIKERESYWTRYRYRERHNNWCGGESTHLILSHHGVVGRWLGMGGLLRSSRLDNIRTPSVRHNLHSLCLFQGVLKVQFQVQYGALLHVQVFKSWYFPPCMLVLNSKCCFFYSTVNTCLIQKMRGGNVWTVGCLMEGK